MERTAEEIRMRYYLWIVLVISALGALAHVVTGRSVFDHQVAQLRAAARAITESLSVPVELYYASSAEGAVVFHKVELQPEEGR